MVTPEDGVIQFLKCSPFPGQECITHPPVVVCLLKSTSNDIAFSKCSDICTLHAC